MQHARRKKGKDKRSYGGRRNATKCPELGQLLYDWFIDCLQICNARVDQPLFLSQARYLKERLLDAGYQPQAMPSMSGEAGKSWFRRWRKRLRVVSRKTVKHLKVSWSKLRHRVRVYLKNVFALLFLWLRCFGEHKQMRWVSWDQQPAWFNNTALDATYSTIGYEPLVTEIEAHSR